MLKLPFPNLIHQAFSSETPIVTNLMFIQPVFFF